jgi:hypothetical protein
MMEKRPLQQILLEKVAICLKETETRSMFITLLLVSTQNGSSTLISDWNSEVSTGRSRKHSGSNRYKKGLPQWNPSSSATKRKNG